MEGVRKTFFNPLASTKQEIHHIIQNLPVGSAHPYSPERILLCRTENGVKEIDISAYPESFFSSRIDLGEMGEVLLERMAEFHQLKIFEDYLIQQAPSSTFTIPLPDGDEIFMLAISKRAPTYYDFCFADASNKITCWNARTTFRGLNHSGDVVSGLNFLAYVQVEASRLVEHELCVFISGYNNTPITEFDGTHPAMLVANHADKILYIVPVPLDKATIGSSTLCCPLVIKRNGNELFCSILHTATTDVRKNASGNTLKSPCFAEAITRADFSTQQLPTITTITEQSVAQTLDRSASQQTITKPTAQHAIIAADSVELPELAHHNYKQIIRFGAGLQFVPSGEAPAMQKSTSTTVLPCVLGDQLQGPLLLATGVAPGNLPFSSQSTLWGYYENLDSLVVFVDDRMTDIARNLASSWRLNAVFVVQLKLDSKPKITSDVLGLLDEANINSVTALAGPQSLVLAQIHDKYYFYRGLANRQYLNSTDMVYGTDVTEIVKSTDLHQLVEPRARRLINLADSDSILMVASGQTVRVDALEGIMNDLPLLNLEGFREDVSGIVPQLQVLLDQKSLQELSKRFITTLSSKISTEVGPLKKAYIKFFTGAFNKDNPEDVKKKNRMLGELRKTTLDLQRSLRPVISSFATMMSTQTTSKRTHDIKRLMRQAQIIGNVEAAKSMTWESVAGLLETHAADMGVLLMNIDEGGYAQLLGNVTSQKAIDAASACSLDSRILHLPGFDAGIILEQSQTQHSGPLSTGPGAIQPTLALPYLSQGSGSGSMLAWVCWDEFVDLKSPYTVRWMEKCNDSHIAAIRILTRSTLAHAIASREYNLKPESIEVGNLMASLLMAGMSKLAAMRTTTPTTVRQADDTSIKLMRGLFGNFLTIAGSGLRPFSMVWQLFGLNPQYDVPTTTVEWERYKQTVQLYPYTGWPLKDFYANLGRLLDKAIIRVVTKAENISAIKKSAAARTIEYCKLRNIQLEHSRTIITVLQRMLTQKDANVPLIASRLVKEIPTTLKKQTNSYSRMVLYLKSLALYEERRPDDDLVIASVYTKRSAAFAGCKLAILAACKEQEGSKVQQACQALFDEHAKVASLWNVDASLFNVQNFKGYKEFVELDLDTCPVVEMQHKITNLAAKTRGDAECKRVPWQLGKKGEYGPEVEPLDESFVHMMLTGKKLDSSNQSGAAPGNQQLGDVDSRLAETTASTKLPSSVVDTLKAELAELSAVLDSGFISDVHGCKQPADVCRILGIPENVLSTFAKVLASPGFDWKENLVENFRGVIVSLLKNRVEREKSQPAARLFGGKLDVDLDDKTKLLSIEG